MRIYALHFFFPPLCARPALFCPQPRQVCDASCGTSRYGDYNCDWKGLGSKCRFCFDDSDIDAAVVADGVAKRHGGRVIMCST